MNYSAGNHSRVTGRTAIETAFVAALLFSLLSQPTFAANVAGYTLDHIGGDYGLPQSSVRALAQDPSGFLWVGTESGLYRFDGIQFDSFAPPFGHGVVNSIAIDRRGRVWASWFTNLTTLYDPIGRKWTTLNVLPPRTSPLGFLEDPSGRIWLSDGSVLYRYDEQTREAISMLELDSTHEDIISQELVWDDGTIWISDAHGVLGYNTNTGEISKDSLRIFQPAIALLNTGDDLWSCHRHQVFRKKKGGLFQLQYENNEVIIRSCALDAGDNLWLGTLDSGAFEFRPNQEVHRHQRDESAPSGIAANHVEKILLDESGRLWLVSPSEVSLYDRGQFFHYPYNTGEPGTSIARQIDLQIIEDRSGVIWLGTAGKGLARLSRFSRKFRSAIPPADDTRVAKPVVDSAGDLWIGMRHDGVYKWDRARDSWHHFAADKADATKLPTVQVRALLSTSTDDLYAGSEVGILNRYDSDIDGWHRIDIGGTGPIYSLLELPDHRIVVGRSGLLSIFSPSTSTTEDFRIDQNASVHATALSRSGRVWVGLIGGPGLMEFDPNRGVVRSWPDLFSSMSIVSVLEDEFGFVWVGTWGNGLIRFDPRTEQLQFVLINDGLNDHSISGILPGTSGDIWISGNTGLARIRNCESRSVFCEPQVERFDTSHGLVNRWFSADSHFVSTSGEIFVGGSNGIDFFHPSLFEENRTPPKISLIDVSLNGIALTAEANSPARLPLPYEFGELEVRFAATDFHDPAKNRYRYRLNGRDHWVPLDNSNRMTLRNLQSGLHELEISGSNNDGVWSIEPITLTLSVAKPAYTSWTAIVAYCALAATLMFALSRYRERRNHSYTLMLERQVEARTRDLHRANRSMADFYANVSHEVRTPLAIIFSAVDRFQKSSSSPETDSVVSTIRRHTSSLSRYVDGLITVSQLESSSDMRWHAVDAKAFLEQMIKDFQPMARNRRIVFQHSEEGAIYVRTQPGALNTVFSNLVVNAIKHAGEDGLIRLSATVDDSFAVFAIEDTGPGVDPAIRDEVFDRGALYSKVSGYGIGLHLVRQAAVALGGKVVVEDSDLGGACFRLWLPVADESLPIVESSPIDGPLEIEDPERDVASSPSAGNGSKPSILLVEDNEELRQNLAAYLSETYEVIESASAEGSLKIAANEVPDIVLCDVLLPDGSGFDVVAQIKGNLITDHIPVVIMTALADEDNRMKGLENRADAYLTKPFQRQTLETTLRNLIQSRRNLLRHAALRIWNESQEGPAARAPKRDFTRRFMAALETGYSNPECNVDFLAKQLAMSRRALERKTRQYLDKAPNELLQEFRLQRAARLLHAGWRIVDLSLSCGFTSPSHFSVVFKKRFGRTPSEYAKHPPMNT